MLRLVSAILFQLVVVLGTVAVMCEAGFAAEFQAAAAPVQLRPIHLRDAEQRSLDSGGFLSFSHDGERLATTSTGGRSLTLWDVSAATWLATFSLDEDAKDDDKLRGSVEFVVGGRLLATSHGDDSIRLFTLDALRPDKILMPPDPTGQLRLVANQWAVSDDGGLIAVPLFFLKNQKKRNRWRVKLVDAAEGSERGELVLGAPTSTCSLSFAPDGRLLAVAVAKKPKHRGSDPDIGIEIWDVGTMKRKYQWTLPRGGTPGAPLPVFVGRGDAVVVQFAPVEGVVATLVDYQLRLWTLTPDGAKELTPAYRANGRHGSRSIGFSADGTWIAAVDADEIGVVKIWDTRYGRLLAEARGTDYIDGLAFSADGTHFATSTLRWGATPRAAAIRELLLWEVPSEIGGAKPDDAPRSSLLRGER